MLNSHEVLQLNVKHCFTIFFKFTGFRPGTSLSAFYLDVAIVNLKGVSISFMSLE